MEYIGEVLWPGQLGHLLVVLSFVAILTATVAYYISTHRRNEPDSEGWRNIGRMGFSLHALATLGIIGTLFYILVKKRYEYQYAWANVSDDLPVQYIFSAFWKEQQGSFLLWSFWHIVLAMVILLRSGKWEKPVMTVIALAETVIASMLLGLYFGNFRFGASPYDLLRHTMEAPIFAQADYLTKITGNGLNPLLQNYWMTIHPPTLFLGFASTVVPFAFAIAGLWLREHKEWLRPALQWSLFSAAVLGTGILMGGAWAYEALSFAGYWAWDPVENSSLVPWITLVAGIHTNLIARATGYSVRSTYAYYLLSFLLILYSTYLTRSGILGDTSAHAFTEMGLSFQLLLFIGLFTFLGFGLWAVRYREIAEVKPEEAGNSREFWMFIGALVLLFSAVLITGATSLPVWNKIVRIFNPDYIGAALADPLEHHNRYQLWIAVFMGLLSGVAQWLRYGERNWAGYRKKVLLHLGIATAAGTALTIFNATWLNMQAWQLFALLFAGMFTVVANADYLITVLRSNLKLAGSAVAHLGFGLLILGILSTGLNKEWISSNKFAMEGLIEGMEGESLNQNVLLMKDGPMPIKGNYEATYFKDTIERQTRTFSVLFKKRDANGNYTGETFTLMPNVMYDRQFSKIVASNPSTQHYLTHDIFTHVSSLPKAELDPEYAQQQEDSLQYVAYSGAVGDTIFTKKHYLIVESITKQPKNHDYKPEKGDLAVGLHISVHALDHPNVYTADPMLYLRPGKGGFAINASVPQRQIKFRLTEATMEQIFKTDAELQYNTFRVKQSESFVFKHYNVRLIGLERDATHPNYQPEPNDIAVGARIEVINPAGQKTETMPLYFIRGSAPQSLKSEVPAEGLHLRLENIDPATGTMTIGIAKASVQANKIPFEIVEDAPRSDYIVLEAIVFPGIKWVWAGSILMLIGLAIAFWRRMTLYER
jgi:cytochrome c-type biogenesis protein CcmF